MIDWFVLLTPLLLLPIVLLLVFAGCQFHVQGISEPFGRPGDIPVQGHYSGDSRATRVAVYTRALPPDPLNVDNPSGRPSQWVIWNGDFFHNEGSIVSFEWGKPGDIPVPGDYGAGYMQPAVFRPSDATWFLAQLYNGMLINGIPSPFVPSFVFGQPSTTPPTQAFFDELVQGRRRLEGVHDIPLPPGDYLGTGPRVVAVFRPPTGAGTQWTCHIGAPASGAELGSFPAGQTGDIVVPGRFRLHDEFAIYHPMSPTQAVWTVFDTQTGHSTLTFNFGSASGTPFPPGSYFPTPPPSYGGIIVTWLLVVFNQFRWRAVPWFTGQLPDGPGDDIPITYEEGFDAGQGDIPAPGDYDGDGIIEAVLFRPSIGRWFRQK